MDYLHTSKEARLAKRLISSIAVILTLFFCLSPIFSAFVHAEDGVVTDDEGNITINEDPNEGIGGSILTDGAELVGTTTDAVTVWFLGKLKYVFRPSFNMFMQFENGEDVTYESPGIGNFEESQFLSTFWQASIVLGTALATVIAVFNLVMCVAGQSKNIRETPWGIFIKYTLVMCGIYFSKQITYFLLDSFSKLWELSLGGLTDKPAITLSVMDRYRETLNGDGGFVLGTQLLGVGWFIPVLVLVANIVIIFKLLSGVLKTFAQCVEKYIILMIALVCVPLPLATLTSNGTKRTFSNYVNLVFSEFLSLMLSVTLFVLGVAMWGKGVFTTSLIGFLIGCSYFKFSLSADKYIARVGLNPVQAGAGMGRGFVGSISSGFRNAMMAVRGAEFVRGAAGSHMITQGLATHNTDMVARGVAAKEPLFSGAQASDAKIQSAATDMMNGQVRSENLNNPNTGAGVYTSWDQSLSVTENLAACSMDRPAFENALARAEANGMIDMSAVSGLEQLDRDGSSFALMDQNGEVIAAMQDNHLYTGDSAQGVYDHSPAHRSDASEAREAAKLEKDTEKERRDSAVNNMKTINEVGGSNMINSAQVVEEVNNRGGDLSVDAIPESQNPVNMQLNTDNGDVMVAALNDDTLDTVASEMQAGNANMAQVYGEDTAVLYDANGEISGIAANDQVYSVEDYGEEKLEKLTRNEHNISNHTTDTSTQSLVNNTGMSMDTIETLRSFESTLGPMYAASSEGTTKVGFYGTPTQNVDEAVTRAIIANNPENGILENAKKPQRMEAAKVFRQQRKAARASKKAAQTEQKGNS